MGRRDFQFYDLYKLKDSKEDVQNLQKDGYRFDVYDPEIYEDIEVADYNCLWQDPNLIKTQFGKSITVQLKICD